MPISKAATLSDLPGCYCKDGEPDTVYIHLGEILADRHIPDCQEARAAMYGTLLTACTVIGLELVIVQEDGVPSIEDVIRGLDS